MSKTLVIMRGLPWTGKSYTAQEILSEFLNNNLGSSGVILSTDQFFYQVNRPEKPDEYSFDPQLLGKAHQWNQDRATKHMDDGTDIVIIDNTNTTPWECSFYAKYGKKAGYNVRIEEPTSERWLEIRRLLKDRKKFKDELRAWSEKLAEGSRESHNVPAFAIEKMMMRWHCDMTVKEALEAK